MNFLAQSSRLIALLINLKKQKSITQEQYTKLCDYAINDNQELQSIYFEYEKGMSETDFLKGIQIILNQQNEQDNVVETYFDSIININKQFKDKIKINYRDIKTDLSRIHQECFLAQHHLQEVKDLLRIILQQFFIEEFHLIQFEEGHQCVILTNNFDFHFFKEEYKISSWAHKQPPNQLHKTQPEHCSILKSQKLPDNYVISKHSVLFMTFSSQVEELYKQFFMATNLYDRFIQIIYQGYQIVTLKKLQTIRMEILQLVSKTLNLYLYKLVYLIILQVIKQFKIDHLLFQCDKEITKHQIVSNYLLILLSTDLDIIGVEIECNNISKKLIEKIRSTFKKSIKKYGKKLKQKRDLLESFQQVTQHNETIMCLFFNNYLNLYYMTVQWNHEQFESKYNLPKIINYGDPIYKIFDKNSTLLANLRQVMDSSNDHLEFNDGYSKFSLKIERGFKKNIKQISVYLFNIQVKRPISDLMTIFRSKVKILLTVRKATLAFKSKQLLLENKDNLTSLVMYLPDTERRRLTHVNDQDKTQDLEKYRNYTMKQATKKIQQFLAKYDEEDKQFPEARRIAIDPNLQQKLQDYEFNLLNKKVYKNKFIISYNLFEMCEYTKQFPIKIKEFINFLTIMKYKYNKKNNPFHNFTHGVNVMHGCYLFAHHQKFGSCFSDLQRFAMVFAGLCHDVDHSGTTNLFQVNAQTKLALLYNDKSVLENHHVAVTYKLLANKQCDFFGTITKQDRIVIRKYVVNNILATDNQYHFNLLNDIEIKFGQSKGGDPMIFEPEENKLLLSGFLTHAADFFGAAKHHLVSRQWSERLRREFMAQSQLEDIIGIAQTSYLRNLDNEVQYAKNEAGFLKLIVKPIYESLNNYSDSALSLQVANINLSIKKYEEIIEQSQNQQ